MSAAILVDEAKPEEYEWCARLLVSSEPWSRFGMQIERARQILHRPCHELFVAKLAQPSGATPSAPQQPVGFAQMNPMGVASSPYITLLAVDAVHRNQGVGSKLLEFAERHFAGERHLFICVSYFNSGAHRLYLRNGYEQVGEFKDFRYDGHIELLLHKRIS